VEKVFSELGFKVDSRFVGPWDAVQLKAKEGEIDAIVALYKTKDREQYLFYSVPYTVDPIEVFVKRAMNSCFKTESLLKKMIATIGDSYGQEIDDLISQQKLEITRVATPEQAFALLEKMKGITSYIALYSGRRVIAESNLTNIHELGTISHENFYIGISKKSPIAELLPEINSILDRYNRDGTIQAIAQKY
jgi:polar amino acid transport system substrate-binding protein